MSDFDLRRTYKVISPSHPDAANLEIQFEAPVVEELSVSMTVHLRSPVLRRSFTTHGVDGVQALIGLLRVVEAFFVGLSKDGYSVYLDEPGDVPLNDFWRSGVRFVDDPVG